MPTAAPASPVFLEVGKRRVFACSVDWPGWCRSGKDAAGALATLSAYAPRYEQALASGGVKWQLGAVATDFAVVERLESSGADFGTLHGVPEVDRIAWADGDLKRSLEVLRVAWDYFDSVVTGAPPELRKGPRGGGRDRDAIAEHVVGAECDYVRRLGAPRQAASWSDKASVDALRILISGAITAAAPSPPDADRRWPARTAARRIAWHVLDHAWEIEDRAG